MTKWALACVILAACGGKKTGDTGGSGSGSSTPAVVPVGATFPKLTAKIDGKDVVMESALIKQKPDGATQLYLTPKKVATCKELLSNVFDGGGDQRIIVDLPVYLGADGKETGGVGDIYMGAPRSADAGATSKVAGPTAKDAKVDVDLAFTVTNGRGQKVDVKGTVTATGCGDQPDEPDMGIPRAKHASTAKMTIAGKSFPVAAIRKGKTFELVDYPRQCMVAKYLGIRITNDGPIWKLDGKRIQDMKMFDPSIPAIKAGSGSGSATPEAPKPTWKITASKAQKGAGTGSDATDATVELALEGEGKIGDYPVKLEGTVEAIDCK